MLKVSVIVAYRPSARSKWDYVRVYFEYGFHIDEPLLVLLIRKGEVAEAIRKNTFYWHIDDMVSRDYEFYPPNRARPLNRRQLQIMAAENRTETIYWITPKGALYSSRQRLKKLYFERNAQGQCELRSFRGVFNGRQEYKKLAVLSKQQERELRPVIKEHFGCPPLHSWTPESRKLLVEKGVIPFGVLFDLYPPKRISKNTRFTIEYKKPNRKKPAFRSSFGYTEVRNGVSDGQMVPVEDITCKDKAKEEK